MGVPWFRVIDTLIGFTDLALSRRAGRRAATDETDGLVGGSSGGGPLGNLETRLTGVVLAALKEAFNRDSHRLALEREQVEAERERAERALRLEWLRQAGDRELARLRLLAGVALASWIATLFLVARAIGGSVASRVCLGAGWALLLGALAAAFAAQAAIVTSLAQINPGNDAVTQPGLAAKLAPWLVVGGLALSGLSALL